MKFTLNPTQLHFVYGVLTLAIYAAGHAVLSYFSVAGNLTGVVSPGVAGLIAALALAAEGQFKTSNPGQALFGAAKVN